MTFLTPLFRVLTRHHRPQGLRGGARRSFLILGCSALLSSMPSARSAEWLLSGDVNAHDPSIIKEDGDYESGGWWWSPATGGGLAMKFSIDGVVWMAGLPVFTPESKPAWWAERAPRMRPMNVWAPDIRKYQGRYWCYYAISEFGRNTSAIGLTSASGIFRGDWREDGVVIASREGVDTFAAIDPSLVIDAEDSPWLLFGSYFDGLHLIQLDPQTMKPVESAPPITVARRGQELGLEGANITYANGYYYLFASVDACCNGKDSTSKIAVARSKNVIGPYVGKEGSNNELVSEMLVGSFSIFERGDDRWAAVGGPNVRYTNDGWIMVRHGYDKNAGGAQKMRINDLYWDADGWPTYAPPPLEDASVAPGKTVTLTAPSSVNYLWQHSTDKGATWALLADNAHHQGSATRMLTITGDAALHQNQYRVVTGNGSATSNAATLTVARAAP
jgi:arabinan endo-1,5-alpha-L-arabinosidase